VALKLCELLPRSEGLKIYIAPLAIQMVSQRRFQIHQLLTLPVQSVAKLINSKAVEIGVRIR
jgi:hypothetical protein